MYDAGDAPSEELLGAVEISKRSVDPLFSVEA
jgi:hypothetical protein